jgi:hypothetical protein
MTKDQVATILARVSSWPDERRQVAELILKIEPELAGAAYDATPDELAAIDEGLPGEGASDVKAAFAGFRPSWRSSICSGPSPDQANCHLLRPGLQSKRIAAGNREVISRPQSSRMRASSASRSASEIAPSPSRSLAERADLL